MDCRIKSTGVRFKRAFECPLKRRAGSLSPLAGEMSPTGDRGGYQPLVKTSEFGICGKDSPPSVRFTDISPARVEREPAEGLSHVLNAQLD